MSVLFVASKTARAGAGPTVDRGRTARGAGAIARTGLLVGAGIALARRAHAAAFYLQEQSVKANGRAFSGEVAERGAQQQWWNPAAIGGIAGFEAYGGVTAIRPSARADDLDTRVVRPMRTLPGLGTIPGSSLPVGGDLRQADPVNDGWLPNGGIAVPLGDRLAAGVTVTSPFSFTTDYADTSWARYLADRTRLRTYDIQPSIAFSPTRSLSIGAAVNVEYVRATLSNFIPDPISPRFLDGHQDLKGDGWDVGYSLGFQFHNDRVDLGASYKSRVRHRLRGRLIQDGLADPLAAPLTLNRTIDPARATFETPWQINVGGRYRPTRALTLNAQVTHFGWERFDAIRLAAPIGQAIPEDYRNTFSYALGADYALSPRLTLRGGVQRDLSPIRDGERDPRVPDGDRWTCAGGASLALTDRMGIDGSVGYTRIASNPIDKDTAFFAGTALQTVVLTGGALSRAHAWVFGLGGHVAFR